MMRPRSSTAPRRGRPRSTAARDAVLDAARALLEESGPLAITMDRLAERSGVGKPTIYRTWANRHEVLMSALMAEMPLEARARRAAPPLAALKAQLRRMAALFASPAGRGLASVLASSEGETEITKAFRSHFLEARREEGRLLMAAAIAAGDLRSGIDVEVALDLFYGPVFYRLLLRHAPLDAAWADASLRLLVEGLGARPEADRRRRTGASV